MNYLVLQFKKRCREEFAQYGFKSYRNNKYRVVNDVYQNFELNRSVSGNNCTVSFGIIPLSVEYNLDKSSGCPWHLKMFENVYRWFDYDRNSTSSMDKCLDDMFCYMRKYLMPFFEQATDSKSAYETICKHKSFLKGNIYEKLCLCLNFGDYEKAEIHLNAIIKQYNEAFERNKEVYGDEMSQNSIQRHKDDVANKQKLLKLIEDKEYARLKEWLAANESRNRKNLNIK